MLGRLFGSGGSDRTPINPVALLRDATGTSAVDLNKLRASGHIELAKAADKAGIALSKRDLSGIRARAVCLLDTSPSMIPDFRNGAVRNLARRMLGFTLQFDTTGRVPLIPFDSHARAAVEVNVDNYEHVVDSHIGMPNPIGSTNMAAALQVVVDMAAKTTQPLYVAVLTDGNPDSYDKTTKVVCHLARFPVFIKFMALKPVPYLAELDNLTDRDRLLDNCNAQPQRGSGVDLLTCTDLEFQDAMAQEWDLWITRALAAGVLRR